MLRLNNAGDRVFDAIHCALSPHQRIMFKLGEKLICVRADDAFKKNELIQGNTYECVDDSIWPLVIVVNEMGENSMFYHDRFLIKPPEADHIRLPMSIARMQTINLARRMGMNCDVIDVGPNYVIARFISDLFKDTPREKRHIVIDTYLREHMKRVLEDFTIIYEAYTPVEATLLGAYT
jgi:hypothetical protein